MNTKAVFVHLGKSPAKHLWLNLMRHKILFPEIETHILIDEPKHIRNIPMGIDVYFYKRESDFLKNKVFNAYDQKFRQGFWRFSLERFFALAEFHETNPNSPILHIESDILLSPNFPWITFDSINKPMWNNYNVQRDVSALLYYPNFQIHSEIIQKIQELLLENSSHTDMTILAEIRELIATKISLFPSLSNSIPELKNRANKVSDTLIDKVSDASIFQDGIFDGAAIGMWFTGHDPRNNYGKAFIHESTPITSGDSLVDPSSVDYDMDLQGNLYVVSKVTRERMKLWCIHIHSKSLKLFSSDWKWELRRFVDLSRNPILIPFFSKSAVWGMLTQSIQGRTFLRFLLGLPIIHKFRLRFSPVKQSMLSKFGNSKSKD